MDGKFDMKMVREQEKGKYLIFNRSYIIMFYKDKIMERYLYGYKKRYT